MFTKTVLRWAMAAMILIGGGRGTRAADAPSAPTRAKADPLLPSIAILQTDKAPVVDGALDDPCWAQAEESRVFTDEYSFPVQLKTTFQVCQKDDALYLAIRALYDEKKPVKTGGGIKHDGALWNGENIEIFLDPDNEDTPGYYQFVLTPFDITGDFYNNEPRDPEIRWEPKYEAKSKWSEKEWTIEYGIPLAAFDRTKTLYENFGLNVHRVDAVYWGIAAWSPGHSEGFHFPHKFGEARGLKGKTVVSNAPGLFRSPYLKVNDRVIRAKANPSLIPEKKPALVSGPEVKVAGHSVEIGFEVNTRTDVAVWIEDTKGERVRHLVAGMLGTNPPAPLKKDALKQTVGWDSLDDFGKKVPAGAYQVKVGVGSKAKLDKEIGRNEAPSQVHGIVVDDKGFLYTCEGQLDQWSRVKKYDRDGKFVSMLLPPPADAPVEKLKGLNIIDYGPDGQVRFGSKGLAQTMPHLDQPFPQTPLVNSKGQVMFAGCEYQGGPARFYKINADGSLPDDFIGPFIKDINWLVYFEQYAKRFHFALDPLDENVIYISGLKEEHRLQPGGSDDNRELVGGRETFYNAVCRVRWGQDAPLETFVGKRNTHGVEGSDKPGEFFDPQGIAFDKANNLWVCDRRNNRLQVFDRHGKFLRQIPHPEPYKILIGKKTGRRYVLGFPPANTTPPQVRTRKDDFYVLERDLSTNAPLRSCTNLTLADLGWPARYKGGFTTFGALTIYDDGEHPRVLAQTNLLGGCNYWWDMALDESGRRPELVVLWTGPYILEGHGKPNHSGQAYRLLRIADLGNGFAEPKVIAGNQPPPTPAYYRIAAGWESDIICAGVTWFDGNSGRCLGRRANGQEVAAARDGRWVVRTANEAMIVFPESWATNPAAGAALTNWTLPTVCLDFGATRGFCVAPNSDVYVARYYHWGDHHLGYGGKEGPDYHVAVDRYSIDGRLIGKRVVHELSGGAHSPAVDIKGNIYVCDNFGRNLGQFYEEDLAANLPSWAPDYHIDEAEWDTLRNGKRVCAGFRKFVQNPLIRSVGAIYKFGPKGGGVLWRAAQAEHLQRLPAHAAERVTLAADWEYRATPVPKRPATHWSSTWLNDEEAGMYPCWLEGVEWEFLGVSPAHGRYNKFRDSCPLFNLRFCVDDFGRVYAPAAHRCTIRMIDTAGNELLRIGRYGNLDSGPNARLKEPNIPLRFPTATALSKRYLYVVENDMPRILRVKLGYEQEQAVVVAVR